MRLMKGEKKNLYKKDDLRNKVKEGTLHDENITLEFNNFIFSI